jgi:hypothetical protein
MISEFIRRCHYRESVSVLVEVDGELEPRELNHNQVRVIISSVLRIWDPVLFWPRDPGWGRNPDLGSGLNIPDHLSESLKAVVWVKNTLMRIRIQDLFDPGSGTRMEKSRIRNIACILLLRQEALFCQFLMFCVVVRLDNMLKCHLYLFLFSFQDYLQPMASVTFSYLKLV